MSVFAQAISVSVAAPAGAAQAVSADMTPALGLSSTDSRWRRFESISGIISYINRQSVKLQPGAVADANSHTVHFRLLRNVLPGLTIKTADRQPIRPSVKQVILSYARHSYTVIAQTPYRTRSATDKPLYQIHYGDETQGHSLCESSVFEWVAGRFCGADC